jgi:hypothetical protein
MEVSMHNHKKYSLIYIFHTGGLILTFAALCFAGCDLIDNSMVDYFLENTEIAEVKGIMANPQYVVMPNGTVLIPAYLCPTATIKMTLSNPRNFTVRQRLLGVPAGKNFTVRQNGSDEIDVDITGAKEGDEYALTLVMQSPDGLRDFPPYDLRIKCISFKALLLDFTINGVTPPAFDPNLDAFTVNVPYSTTSVTLTGTASNTDASLVLYRGKSAALDMFLKSGIHTIDFEPVPLNEGFNYFFIKVTSGLYSQDYTVTIYRGKNPDKAIMLFTITSPVLAEGTIDEGAHAITVTVPFGTNAANMTAQVSHTGVSISPNPALGRDYTGPVTYAVIAADSTSQTYTVTVTPPRITISAITSSSIPILAFNSPPPSVPPEYPISITIIGTGVTVTEWYIDVNGPVTLTATDANSSTFKAPAVPGFYNVNVIAVVGGVDYSGSFGLIVN